MPIPHPLAAFFTYFPVRSYPPIPAPKSFQNAEAPTLWIAPPLSSSPSSIPSEDRVLSSDVECLKWQAYIALRGLTNMKVRWDIAPEGALEGRLPNLHLPKAEADKLNAYLNPDGKPKANPEEQLYLYAAAVFPSWVDLKMGVDSTSDVLEGYKDLVAKDESRAWVALLEGVVHAALLITQHQQVSLSELLGFGYSSRVSSPDTAPSTPASLQTVINPPPAPLVGFSSLLPPLGARVSRAAVISQYVEAVASLSERLGTDQWFLGSSQPTPLDALAFAYLHCILVHSKDPIRIEVTKRVNLVAWEWRVRCTVRSSFSHIHIERRVEIIFTLNKSGEVKTLT